MAQIAITAISLPYLHRVARAAWIVSLVSAIMAVFYTSVQHQVIGRLLHPTQIRAWIAGNPEVPKLENITNKPIQERLREVGPEILLPRPTSVLLISVPVLFLTTALNAFLVGLGMYLGLIWQGHLDINADVDDSKYVFMAYIVSASVCYIIYMLLSVVRNRQGSEDMKTLVRTLLTSMATYIKESARPTVQ